MQYKISQPYKKDHSEMSTKNANLDTALKEMNEDSICNTLSTNWSEWRITIPHGEKLSRYFEVFTIFGEERVQASESYRMRWEYWNSLEMTTFGRDMIPHTLAWKNPLEGSKEGVYRGSGAVVYAIQDREKEAG